MIPPPNAEAKIKISFSPYAWAFWGRCSADSKRPESLIPNVPPNRAIDASCKENRVSRATQTKPLTWPVLEARFDTFALNLPQYAAVQKN